MEYSPTFNLDRVRTPIFMWEGNTASGLWDWYAGLRRLDKPVEYWVLRDAAHDVYQAGQRIRTHQLLIDWFRFWLKGEERTELLPGADETAAKPPLLKWSATPIT